MPNLACYLKLLIGPQQTRRSLNVGITFVHRLRRWTNVKSTFCQRLTRRWIIVGLTFVHQLRRWTYVKSTFCQRLTRRWIIVGLTFVHHLRRWSNVKSQFIHRLVSARWVLPSKHETSAQCCFDEALRLWRRPNVKTTLDRCLVSAGGCWIHGWAKSRLGAERSWSSPE